MGAHCFEAGQFGYLEPPSLVVREVQMQHVEFECRNLAEGPQKNVGGEKVARDIHVPTSPVETRRVEWDDDSRHESKIVGVAQRVVRLVKLEGAERGVQSRQAAGRDEKGLGVGDERLR